MERMEEACMRLCLLTCAAWEVDLPSPLTRREVHRLLSAGVLQGLTLRHADTLTEEKAVRICRLLARARAVVELLRAYEEKGYALLLPGDALWPEQFYHLGERAPHFLFAKGHAALLRERIAAVAGSRDIQKETIENARLLGRRLAREGITMVTGGAKGVDRAAQQGALEAGGNVILIPALPAAQMMDTPLAQRSMEEGRLLILCDQLPDSPFTPAKALARNHAIYALGEAAIVAAARDGVGGSWRGAMDCLSGGWTPVFVPADEGEDMAGCRRLETLGAVRLDIHREGRLSNMLFARRQLDMFACLGR